jgi:Cu/Ag efflux protein CusF
VAAAIGTVAPIRADAKKETAAKAANVLQFRNRLLPTGTKPLSASYCPEWGMRRTPMKLSKAVRASAVISATCTAALAQQTLSGTITKVDEQKGTITIQQTQSGTVGSSGEAQEFKAQDGLLFNALRPGDRITFTISEVKGAKTITNLNKQ